MSATVQNRDYTHSIKKHYSRMECIVLPYRNNFNIFSLPKEKQYWTLCNLCEENNEVKQGSEYDLIVNKEKLCSPNQFYGVELDKTIANRNMLLTEGNWFHNDFHEQMLKETSNNNFNPGLINIDTGFMPERAVDLLNKILLLISDLDISNVYVILNYVLKCRCNRDLTINAVIKELENSNIAEAFHLKNWKLSSDQYLYNGTTAKSKTVMASIGFLLK